MTSQHGEPQPDQERPEHTPQPPRPHGKRQEAERPPEVPRAHGRRREWASLIEERIQRAQAEGAFDNLPGAGKPLHLDVNPLAGERALAFSLLKAQRVAPREIELGREIDADLLRAEALVAELRRRRADLAHRLRPPLPSELRAYAILRASVERRYAEALRAIAQKILTLSVLAPPALHRSPIDVQARLDSFRAEFPPTEDA